VYLASTAKKIASKTVTVSQARYAWVTAEGYCNLPDPPLNLRFMLDTSPDTFNLNDPDHIWIIDEFTTPNGLVNGSGFPQHGWHLSEIFPINAGTTTFYANGIIAWGHTTSTTTSCRGHVTVFFTTQAL
jgi:hypothetical protein